MANFRFGRDDANLRPGLGGGERTVEDDEETTTTRNPRAICFAGVSVSFVKKGRSENQICKKKNLCVYSQIPLTPPGVPPHHRNSRVRMNGRVRISQRWTLAHWFSSRGRSR